MVDPSVYPFYQRLSQNPDDAEALFVLWQWHGDRLEFQQLATLVEQVASRRLDATSAADLFYRAGELWAKNVGRVDKAVGNYRRAFELDPNQIAAIEAARAIYVQLGNLKLAAQLYERQLGSTGDPAQRLVLLRELAGLRAQMGDPSGQAAALEEVIRISPEDLEATRELAAAYLARADGPGGSDEDRMRAGSLLAMIARGLGGESTVAFAEAALDAWAGEETAFELLRESYLASGRGEELAVRQINFISANPGSPLAVAVRKDLASLYLGAGQVDDAIEALAPLAANDMEAARTLIGLYREAGRTSELVGLLIALPPASEPAQRMADLREIAEVSGQQGDREAMISALRELLTIDPTDPEALALVEDDLRARNAFEDLRQVLYAAARAPNAPVDARRTRLREIALLSEQRMADVPGAIEAWRALLSVDAGDEEAGAALEKLLTRSERWDELARWLDKRASAATDRGDRRALLERLVEIHRTRRNDEAGEADALRALWDLDRDDGSVALRLIDVRRRIGDLAGVSEVLRARAEASEGEDAAHRWSELAAHLEIATERDEAIQAWQQVATLEPANVGAWAAVERLLERTGRHDLLLETLIAHAEGPANEGNPAPLHARAADIARVLGDVTTATAQAERALALAPEDDAVASMLMDLYEAAGTRDRLITLLNERAARTPDGDVKIAILRRAAHTVGQTDPESSARLWGELREVAKRSGKRDDSEALEALAGFAEISGDTARMAELLLESSVYATEPEQQRALLMRRAELLAGDLNRPDDAIATLRDITERVDPKCGPAWGRIAELALATGKPTLAAEAFEHQIALIEDDEQKAAAAGRLADLCEKELKDVPRALSALETQYDADPTDYTVVTRLARLNEHEERWAEVVKYLVVLAEVEGDEEELSVMLQHIADIAEKKLGSSRKAFDLLLPQAKAGDIAVLEALRGVAERGKLEAELIPVLSDLAQRVGSPQDRATLWREIAHRHETALQDPTRALDAYLKALIARPTEIEGLDPIDRLATLLRAHAVAAQAYSVVLAGADDPAVLRDVAVRGIAFLESVGAIEPALDLALSSQGRLPAEDALLDAVVRLAPAANRGDEMFVAFDRRRNASKDEAERYRLMLRASERAMLALDDRETSFNYLRMAVSQAIAGKNIDEDRLAAVEAMARTADHEKPEAAMRSGVVDLYGALGEEHGEDNPRAAAVAFRRAADVCSADLGLADHAYAFLFRAVALWPADDSSAGKLEAIATQLNRCGEVVDFYQRVIDDAYDAQTARSYQARRATLLGDALGRVDDAIEALRQLIEIAPKDLEGVHALQAMLRKHARHQDLLMALERELEMGAADRLAVLKEIARVWQTGLRNAFEAKDAWKRVLKLAPGDTDARAALDALEKKRAVVEDEDDAPAPAAMAEAEAEPEPVESLDSGDLADSLSSMEIAAPPRDASLDEDNTTGARIPAPDPDFLDERDESFAGQYASPSDLPGTAGDDPYAGNDLTGEMRAADLQAAMPREIEPESPPANQSIEAAMAHGSDDETLQRSEDPLDDTGNGPADFAAEPQEWLPGESEATLPPGIHSSARFPSNEPMFSDAIEPSAELLAPDALEDLETLEAMDSEEALDAEELAEDELEPEELLAEPEEEASLDSLARMVTRGSDAPPPSGRSPSRKG